MAKKKRSSSGKRSKGSQPGRAASQAGGLGPLELVAKVLAEMPEEVQAALLQEMMGQADAFFEDPFDDLPPASRVQELIDEARRQPTAGRSIAILEEAEQAARKKLGRRFDKLAGRFGESDAGLDYLDVKVELAGALSAAGEGERALAHAEEAMRLDPSDPAGVRATLLAEYLSAGRDDDADRLLREHCPEPWPEWQYGRLLIELRRHVRGKPVDDRLRSAHRKNPFILPLLLGEQMPATFAPPSMDPGDEGAAHYYASDFLRVWRETPGAVSWLREAAARLKLEMPKGEEEQPATLLPRDEVAALPLHSEPTWVVGIHEAGRVRLPGMDRPKKHWLMYALAAGGDAIGFDVSTRQPRAGNLWKMLLATMLDQRPPARPQTLLVAAPDLEGRLRRSAAGTGIEVGRFDQPERLKETFDRLVERVQGGQAGLASLEAGAIQNAPLDPDEVWEAAVVQFPQRIEIAGRSVRPSAALVMSRHDGTVLWHEMFVEPPPASALDSAVRMAIARPAVGPPRRPRQVFVRDHDEAVSLQALADEAGFHCDAGHTLEMIEAAMLEMGEAVLGGPPPIVLAEVEGLALSDQERFYAAAAQFYRARPWRQFAMDEAVVVQPVQPPGPTLYGLVMGQSGMTLGAALYYRLDDIREMFAGPDCDEPVAHDSLSVTFGEEGDLAPADLDAVEQFGWPIAAPEAYPGPMRVRPGPEVEAPTAAELRVLTAVLEGTTRMATGADRELTVNVGEQTVRLTRAGSIWDH